ncbi:hypothetical protein ACFSCV_14720 [Methylopila henanensis]|uniref:Esterase n=1 Tax=Methylopila henanensis TaxID=873516 RepID=A0ABW4K8Y8_9HYPH
MSANVEDVDGDARAYAPDEVNPEGLAHIAGRIRRSLRPGPRRPTLVIVFSARLKFQLGGLDFGATTLDLADSRNEYYLVRVLALRRGLSAFIEDNDFRTVCCIGGSKGGFGALMTSRLLAEQMPDRTFSAMAFSPQTRLWPQNAALRYPTYHRFLDRLGELDMTERRRVRRYADQSRPVDLPNLRWFVSYGTLNDVDAAEAKSLRGSSVVLDPLPISYHGSLLFYMAQGLDRAGRQDMLRRFRKAADADEDVAFVNLTEEDDDILRETEAAPDRPPFMDMARWVIRGAHDHDRP